VGVLSWWLFRAGHDGGAAKPVGKTDLVHDGRRTSVAGHAEGGRRIAGTVEFSGAGIAHAMVRLVNESGELKAASDANGRFDFGPQPVAVYEVVAQADKVTGAVRRVDLRQPDLAADELHLVLYSCDASVHGTVRDVSGGAIPNARVARSIDALVGDMETSTGGDGTYDLCVPMGESSVLVSADGYATIASRLPTWGRALRDFELSPEATIQGRVVRASDHTPIVDAVVDLQPVGLSARTERAVSDADGRFHFAGVFPGLHEIRASAPGLATPRAVSVAARVSGGTEIICELAPAFSVAGRVVEDGSGRGVTGVRVVTADRDEHEAVSGADGAFELDAVPSSEYRPRIGGEQRHYPNVVVGGAVRDLTFPVTKRVAIGGRVTRKQQAIEGADVSAGDDYTVSDRDGLTRFACHVS
jgi:Carboxypeptidase regulatory-like domain